MRLVLAALVMFSSISAFAGGGICKNDAHNPHFAQLCAMQGQNAGKHGCKMTNGCVWISIQSDGICRNNAYNPHFAQLCAMQGQNGGENACKMTNGCEWIEID